MNSVKQESARYARERLCGIGCSAYSLESELDGAYRKGANHVLKAVEESLDGLSEKERTVFAFGEMKNLIKRLKQ